MTNFLMKMQIKVNLRRELTKYLIHNLKSDAERYINESNFFIDLIAMPCNIIFMYLTLQPCSDLTVAFA